MSLYKRCWNVGLSLKYVLYITQRECFTITRTLGMCSCSIQKQAIHRHLSGVLWDFKRKRSPVGSRQLWSICDVGPLQRIVTDMVDNSIVRVTHDSATSISRIHHSTQLRKYLLIYCRSLRMMPFDDQKLSRNYSKTPKIWRTTL